MFSYDPFAFASYEKFLLFQYNTKTEGLYFGSGTYYIFCPGITKESIASDGTNIHRWFDDHKMMGTPINLVNQLPDHSIRIDAQLDQVKPLATGYLITKADLDYEIDLLIPNIFPDYNVNISYPTVHVVFDEPVTAEGINELNDIFERNAFPLRCEFSSDPKLSKRTPTIQPIVQSISTFRSVKAKLSKGVAEAWERDEDNWSSDRKSILTGSEAGPYYTNAFNHKQLSGLIDASVLFPDNIRNYLSLFDQVHIILPLANRLDITLTSLGVSRDEFTALVELNKVKVLLPASIEKYDLSFIENLLEVNPANVHLSRQLTGISIQEEAKRNPLFFPSIPTGEKRLLLQVLSESLSISDSKIKSILNVGIGELGHGWFSVPTTANQQGSLILPYYGISQLLNLIFQHIHKKNLVREIMVCAPPVLLSAATGSVLIPAEQPDFSTAPLSEMIAELYSGVPDQDWVIQKPAYANFASQELLVIADKVPVVEFAKTFSSAEITRFRELLLGISRHSNNTEDLEETIQTFNHFVREYEKGNKHFSMWGVAGFVLGLAGKATGSPYGSWVAKWLTKLLQKKSTQNEFIGSFLDKLEGQVQGAFPSAILVSKMKDKLKKKI